jgi:hypothetical protein
MQFVLAPFVGADVHRHAAQPFDDAPTAADESSHEYLATTRHDTIGVITV